MPMSHSPEFAALVTSLYDAQANLEAKLRIVKVIRTCADRYAEAESGADVIEEICNHVDSFNRLNDTGADILKSLNKALQELVIAG